MIKKWWHGKVAYQIYPKSFLDTNGDGIGDLRGVINKLDYLKDLGVDIIWLSPIYPSPFKDQGYDISDYENIDPIFGNMDDMDELLAEAKKRDMYILMDLVVNHCSDEHVWFKKACEDPDGEYGKYFYIETVKDGKLPTNWRSYFGGSVWDKLPGHEDKYYLHMFHKKQPDLNWENKAVRDEIYAMINRWMKRGLAGFRVDAIINIKKALPFMSYEPDREDGMCSAGVMLAHANGVGDFLSEMNRECFEPYDAFTVGEVFDAKEDEIGNFVGDRGYFSSIFDFSTTLIGHSPNGWYANKKPSAKDYINAVFNAQNTIKEIGFMSNIIENHDEPRGVSRYLPEGECTLKGKKMLGLISFMVRGIPFIYQGQEIGMENCEFTSVEQFDDISTLDEYRVALEAGLSKEEALRAVSLYSRDNARTPMQWSEDENAGFSAAKPWMMLNPKYKEINVEAALKNENSVYYFYRELARLRKSEEYKEVITYGDLERIFCVDENIMAFTRKLHDKILVVLANFQNKSASIDISYKVGKVLINNDSEFEYNGGKVELTAFQALVLEVE